MKSPIIAAALAAIPVENTRFVDKNLDISEQVYALLEQKGLTQKQFAQMLGKSESEVSKWLSGLHNLTLKSIAKMEVALGEDIVITPQQAQARYAHTVAVRMELPPWMEMDEMTDQPIADSVAGNYAFAA